MSGTKKLNTFDILLIALIVLAVLCVAVYLGWIAPNQETKLANQRLSYTIEVDQANPELGEKIKVGDIVNIGVAGVDQSVVTGVTVNPAEKVLFDQVAGVYRSVPITDKQTILLTLEGNATIGDMNISIGETPVRVGSELAAKGKGYAAVGFVVQSDLLN